VSLLLLPLLHAALLQAQATELSSRYGVSTQLDGIVRQLWLAHLPTTGILESRPRQPAAAAAQARLLRKQQKKKQKQPRGNNAAAAADPAINAGSGVAAGQQRKLPGGAHKAAAELVKPHNMRRLFWKVSAGHGYCSHRRARMARHQPPPPLSTS
jgi:predicted lipid-binding transport protein (Tim44 family)